MPYTLYDQRVVGFVDVLGFSKISMRLSSEDPEVDFVYFLLNAPDFAKANLEMEYEAEFSSFSDNVVASSDLDSKNVWAVLYFCANLQWLMIVQGYLCRGAITTGLLHHSAKAIFGSGLVEAYNLEREVAKYPRIIISDDAYEILAKGADEVPDLKDFIELLHVDDQGTRYLRPYWRIIRKTHKWSLQLPEDENHYISPQEDEDYRKERRAAMAAELDSRLESAEEEKDREKIIWLQSELEDCVR